MRVQLPGVLADLAGGSRCLEAPPGTLTQVLDILALEHPVLVQRLRDETGALRRYVNFYLDGADVRSLAGLETPVPEGSVLQVLPSVAGG